MPTLTDDQWLTRSEVAERLRVPARTLAQWATKAKGRAMPSLASTPDTA